MSGLPWTPVKIAWISGVSRVGSRGLSTAQLAFMDSIPGPAQWKLRSNFPYSSEPAAAPLEPVPLLWASTVNAARFLAASQPMRRRARLEAWSALKASCDVLLLVSLSCGSQIAWAMERRRPSGARVKMLSLGPVDFGCGPMNRRVFVGDRDRISRSPNLRTAERLPGVGHLDYASSKAAHLAVSRWLEHELEVVQVTP